MIRPGPGGGSTMTNAANGEEAIASNETLLERIVNFLGDEDIHRNYDFLPHMNRVDEYLRDLFVEYIGPRQTKAPDFPVARWELATLMVKTHKEWLAKDREVKPIDFEVVKMLIEERTNVLTSDSIRQPTGQVIIPAPVQPTNPVIPKEVPLNMALPKDHPDRKKLIDPLHYTKRAAQRRRLEEYVANHTEDDAITSHLPAPKNFRGPYVKPITSQESEQATDARLVAIDGLITKLRQTQVVAPRLLLEKVIARFQQGYDALPSTSNVFIDDGVEDFQQWTTSEEAHTKLTKEEVKLLTILTEPSWDLEGRPANHPRAQLNKHPEDRFHNVEIPNLGLTRTVRYNGDGDLGPMIKMDHYSVFQRLAYRLGAERRGLEALRENLAASLATRINEIEELRAEETTQYTLEDDVDDIIEKIVGAGGTQFAQWREWTDSQKQAILRDAIINESLKADTDRTLDHAKLWEFANRKESATGLGGVETQPKRFFSVSRWPTDVLSPQVRREMQAKAPIRDVAVEEVKLTPEEMAAVERAHVASYFAPPPRERFIRGEPFYPFGETRIQERIKSEQILSDLEGVEGYDFRTYTDDDTGSGFLGVLNPFNWWRKRKPEDDGNVIGGKRRNVGR